MRLNSHLRVRLGNGGANTDVDDGPPLLTHDGGLGCVNAAGRQRQAVNVEVGRGEPELPPEAVAGDYFASQRVGASEHLAGGIQVAGTNDLTNACAADRAAIQRDRCQAVDNEVEFAAELLQ